MNQNYCLKKINFIFCSLFLFGFARAQNNFIWVKGSPAINQQGTYGTQGVASPANNPGGRMSPASWKDAMGNLWLFGGFGYDASLSMSYLNDMWKYDVGTGQWIWIKGSSTGNAFANYGSIGVPAPSNNPGGVTQCATWTDAAGNFWLFGGDGYGPSSSPSKLNDLWKYNPGTNEWTWIKGNNTVLGPPGVYGTMGTSSPANIPGGRSGSASWTDASGNFWLYGGSGQGFTTLHNDLWKYNTSTNEWTWMRGSSAINQGGFSGTKGTPAPANEPGAREGSTAWVVGGVLWLFGGYGWDPSAINGLLNDVWKYDISTNNWTWMSGNNLAGEHANYGTLGVTSPSNRPGARSGAKGWSSVTNLFLFGGEGFDDGTNSGPTSSVLSDVWKYSTTTNEWTWTKGPKTLEAPGSYGNMGVSLPTNIPGARGQTACWKSSNGDVWVFGGWGIALSNPAGCLNDLWKLNSCTSQTLGITSTRSVMCSGQQAVLTANGATTYSWSTSQTGASNTISPTTTTSYTVYSTDFLSCNNSASITQSVTNCSGLDTQENPELNFSIYPNPNTGEFQIDFINSHDPVRLVISNSLGQIVFETDEVSKTVSVQSHLAAGLYHVQMIQPGKQSASEKLIIK